MRSENVNGPDLPDKSDTGIIRVAPYPHNLKEWLHAMAACPECLALVANTDHMIHRFEDALNRWKALDHPDPESWLETDLADHIRRRCSLDCSNFATNHKEGAMLKQHNAAP